MAIDPRYTHTLIEFIAAGQSSTDLSYSKLSYVEKRDGIDFPVHNIIDDYIDELKEKCLTITLSDSEWIKYRFRPKLLANDVYGTTEAYFLILLLNNICDIKEFYDKSLKMLKKDDLFEALSQIYNVEKDNLILYNK